MKKFSLFVVLIALALSACSQYQPPEEKQLSNSELREIILNGKEFQPALQLIENENISLNWQNLEFSQENGNYSIDLPDVANKYMFNIDYNTRTKSIGMVTIISAYLDPKGTKYLTITDLNTLEATRLILNANNSIEFSSTGMVDNIHSIKSTLTIVRDLDKPKFNIATQSSSCTQELRAMISAIDAIRSARNWVRIARAAKYAAALDVGLSCTAAGPLVAPCLFALSEYSIAKLVLNSANEDLRIAKRDADYAQDDLVSCLNNNN